MTVEELLAIRTPEAIFPPAIPEAREVYRKLARKMHPDASTHPQAAVAFAKLTWLHDWAKEKLEGNYWGFAGKDELYKKEIRYHRKFPFELGECWIVGDAIVYAIDHRAKGPNRAWASRRFATLFEALGRAEPKVAAEMKKRLPVKMAVKGKRPNEVLIVHRGKEWIRLRDLREHLGGQIEARHTAWILSGLFNLLCYLHHIGIVHGEISMDTYYVDPVLHDGALLGGWFYWKNRDEPIEWLPQRSYHLAPFSVRANKKATSALDAELIKGIGRELLGDLSRAPKAMADFLRRAAKTSAMENYQEWEETLRDSFGPRRFIQMNVKPDAVYP